MNVPMYFKFMAHIENMSKKSIIYIPCQGDYASWTELDPQVIPSGVTVAVTPNQNGGIFSLIVAGVKRNIINIPDLVFAHLHRPHDMGATKRKASGYRIEFDTDKKSSVPVIQGQCVHVKVDESDKITFEVKFDEAAYSTLIKELTAQQQAPKAP
jgi:hypothetical protein